ncbi:2OG-Fe dioxygenase family protein [Streptomyces sp. NPDC046197]|uniref:2OG-Fe dioxygenase family protein n=1 Tax=Streptomyces sp. NPDC046197 TaxID=3154337 RepID=UPI0033C34AB0
MHTTRPTASISSSTDITDDIVRTGFSMIPGSDMQVPPALQDSLKALIASFDDLPADPYLPDGGRYRYRRHTRYIYRPATGELLVADNPGYFQTVENNPFAGGQWRKYEELQEEIRSGAFLAALIDFNVGRLPMPEVEQWAVQVQCVRIVARDGACGRPIPEGVHRDGCTYVSLHMINRHNISGGRTSVCTPEHELITEKVFTECLDSFFGDDPRVRHGVGDVAVAEPGLGEGTRDMLLMSYDPM